MTIASIMTPDPLRISSECTLEKALRLMTEHRLRHLPVVDHGRLVGILSERDLLEATGWRLGEHVDPDSWTATVRDSMSVPVETITPRHDLPSVCERLMKHGIGCLPVLEEGQLVGILSEFDVIETFVRLCRTPRLLEEFDPIVADQMTPGLITIESGAPAAEALELQRAHRIRHLPVLFDGWFVGIVSDRDLRLLAGAGRLEGRTVGAVMTTDLATIGLGDRLSLAARLMVELHLSAAPVTDQRRLVGIVTSSDVLEWCGSLAWPESLEWLAREPIGDARP